MAMRVAMHIMVNMAGTPLAAAMSPSNILKSICSALNRCAAIMLIPVDLCALRLGQQSEHEL